MKTLIRTCAAALFLFASSQGFAAKVGAPAPAFTGTDIDGKTFNLADAKGKFVVLEWHNELCPYVKKHYDSGNMQKLQDQWMKKDVVWVKVNSSAPGKQGHVTVEQEKAYLKKQKSKPSHVLLDPEGTIGKAFDSKVTPHMFVIDPKGTLIYNGAIDDKPTADKADIKGARNYVNEALTLATANKPVTTASTTPYGCGTKYKN